MMESNIYGEKDLARLLATLSPRLESGEYVFCSIGNARYGDYVDLEPVASITESEGLTLILPRAKADAAGLVYASVFARITLRVHSSLDAVGLTAAFSAALTDHGISANVVAGFYHDHLFVQAESAQQAVTVLEALARQGARDASQ